MVNYLFLIKNIHKISINFLISKKFLKIFIFFLLFIYNAIKLNFYNIPKISIFLPIYNKEIYLQKSIKSIQRQSLKEIEIIAINDYSRDNSLNVLKEINKKEIRLKIINNDKNYGLLYSRAMGIINSKGEFIMNLDPDDELLGYHSLEYIYGIAKKKKVDVVLFSYLRNNKNINKCKYYMKILKQPIILKTAFNIKNELKDFIFCNKLIKKNLLIKVYLKFKEKINSVKWNYHEDNIWSILIHKYAKSMLCIKNAIYNYKFNNDSLMNNRGNILEFKNIIYRTEMFIKIFDIKNEKKFIIPDIRKLIEFINQKIYLSFLNNNFQIKKKIINILNICFSDSNCSKLISPKIQLFIKN